LYGKVRYIVTDSPVILGAFYCEYYHNQKFMGDMVRQYYIYAQDNDVEFLNLWVDRDQEQPYDARGRFENENQANEIGLNLKRYLADNHIPINVKNVSDLFEKGGKAYDRN